MTAGELRIEHRYRPDRERVQRALLLLLGGAPTSTALLSSNPKVSDQADLIGGPGLGGGAT